MKQRDRDPTLNLLTIDDALARGAADRIAGDLVKPEQPRKVRRPWLTKGERYFVQECVVIAALIELVIWICHATKVPL